MSIYQERRQVLHSFTAAQFFLSVAVLCVALVTQKKELMVAIILALALQWLQLFCCMRPARVSKIRQWLRGMMRAVAWKYFIFASALVVLLRVLPVLSDPKEFMSFISVFFVAYLIPFWYCGMRHTVFALNAYKPRFFTVKY